MRSLLIAAAAAVCFTACDAHTAQPANIAHLVALALVQNPNLPSGKIVLKDESGTTGVWDNYIVGLTPHCGRGGHYLFLNTSNMNEARFQLYCDTDFLPGTMTPVDGNPAEPLWDSTANGTPY